MGYKFIAPKLKLLYRVSKDGEKASKFWDICGGKGPALVLIKSKKGNKFGGYRTKPF